MSLGTTLRASGAVLGHAATRPVAALRPRMYLPTGLAAGTGTALAVTAVSVLVGVAGSMLSGLAIGAVVGAVRPCSRK